MTAALVALLALIWLVCLIGLAEYHRAKQKPVRRPVQVSVGYVCDMIETEGEMMQNKIRFNHIALMPDGEMEISTNKGRIPCPPQSEEFKRNVKLFLNGRWYEPGELAEIPPSDFIIEVPRE